MQFDVESLESRQLLSVGEIDRSFGDRGIIVGSASLPPQSDLADLRTIATLPTTRRRTIVVAVGVQSGFVPRDAPYRSQIVAYRLLADGVVDSTFGDRGYVMLRSSDLDEFVEPVAATMTSENRLLIAACVGSQPKDWLYGKPPARELMAFQLTPSGKLDRTFSDDGKQTVLEQPVVFASVSVTADADSRAVFAAANADEYGYDTGDSTVIRLRRDGSFDPRFDGDGVRSLGNFTVTASTLDRQNRIVLGGTRRGGDVQFLSISRLAPSGRRDPSFTELIDTPNPSFFVDQIVANADGSLIYATDRTIARLKPSGAPDDAFADNGALIVASTADPQIDRRANRFIVRADGAITVGYIDRQRLPDDAVSDPITAGILRLTADGRVIAVRSIPVLQPQAELQAQQPDGRLLFGEATAMRRTTAVGVPDPAFANEAVIVDSQLEGLVVDTRGRLLVADTDGSGFGAIAYQATGRRDRSYGAVGRVGTGVSFSDQPVSVVSPLLIPFGDGRTALMTQGKLPDGGDGDNGDGLAAILFVARSDGTIDPRFPNPDTGIFLAPNETNRSKAHASPGGYLSVFYSDYTYSSNHLLVFDSNGQRVGHFDGGSDSYFPDPLTGSAFEPTRAVPAGMARGLYISGTIDIDVNDDNELESSTPALRRRTADGQDDPAFGVGGILRDFDGVPLAAQADGRLLYSQPGKSGLRRLNTSGTTDRRFGTNGVAAAGFERFDLDNAGRIIAWRVLRGGAADGDVQVMRLGRNGNIDRSFGRAGVATVDTRATSAATANLMTTSSNQLIVTALQPDSHYAKSTWSAVRLTA